MLKEIGEDKLNQASASNQPVFSTEIDYDALVRQRSEAVEHWRKLDATERAKFKNQADYDTQNNVPDLKDEAFIPAKNLSLVLKEIRCRLENPDVLSPIAIEPLDFDDAALELAESLENVTEIREVYRLRKAATGPKENAGINTEEAARLKNCFSQGRELFLAGKHGSLMVKPLNFFYALTAYAYGIIILNNPLRYRKDMLPGSHGMSYLPAVIQAQFGGDSPRGTFSELVGAFPTQLIKTPRITINIDCSPSLIAFHKTRFDVSLGTLLSTVPEMADYYKLTTGRPSRCFPLEIASASDPRSLTWEFHIGNGETRPPPDSILQAFGDFSQRERYGKIIVTIPAERASSIKACIYTDIRGNLWFVDNPFFPIILPEISTHFLITSIFSNIMRYRPEEWGSVLVNDVPSSISLLTRHYFSSFERKFLLLVLRTASRYLPYAA